MVKILQVPLGKHVENFQSDNVINTMRVLFNFTEFLNFTVF